MVHPVIEMWADTGECIERDFTPEERAQYDVDAAAHAATVATAAESAAAKATARSKAIAHAKSLGFTDEMISVMYPTLVEE